MYLNLHVAAKYVWKFRIVVLILLELIYLKSLRECVLLCSERVIPLVISPQNSGAPTAVSQSWGGKRHECLISSPTPACPVVYKNFPLFGFFIIVFNVDLDIQTWRQFKRFPWVLALIFEGKFNYGTSGSKKISSPFMAIFVSIPRRSCVWRAIRENCLTVWELESPLPIPITAGLFLTAGIDPKMLRK